MTERADHKTRFSSDNQPVKNGRPKEARDKLSRAFLHGLAEDFEEHGKTAIEKVRTEDPSTYLRVVASLQPKELEISNPMGALSDEKLTAAIEELSQQIKAQAPPADDQPETPVKYDA